MMNRIDSLFKKKQQGILSVYFTAGFPQLNDTRQIINLLQKNGVDMIEIGIPFSDPLADGPVIQQSGDQALKNGMSLKLLFQQLKDIRNEISIPLILMGYINPVMKFGIENFCQKCNETGIDGIILPDLPLQEYVEEYQGLFEKYGLFNILLMSPQTSNDRIKQIDTVSKGFVYMVSSSSTTGAKSEIEKSQLEYFKRVAKMNLKNPRLIGFGISDNYTFNKACEFANGAIVGSAFINSLNRPESLEQKIISFVQNIKEPKK